MPDRDGRLRGKYSKISFTILFLIISLDVIATLAVRSNTHILYLFQNLLSPISWLFDALGIPISSNYLDGPEPLVYYRILMLLSALLGASWGVISAWHFCKRYRFFRYPAYYAKVAQKSAARGPKSDISTNFWFYFIFLRLFFVSLLCLTVITIWAVYPGRFTFHVKDFVVPIVFSLLPGLFWSFLPLSMLSLTSCLCSDLNAIKRAYINKIQ
jgi:hypothetical protein